MRTATARNVRVIRFDQIARPLMFHKSHRPTAFQVCVARNDVSHSEKETTTTHVIEMLLGRPSLRTPRTSAFQRPISSGRHLFRSVCGVGTRATVHQTCSIHLLVGKVSGSFSSDNHGLHSNLHLSFRERTPICRRLEARLTR
jgi:hypothetical protein